MFGFRNGSYRMRLCVLDQSLSENLPIAGNKPIVAEKHSFPHAFRMVQRKKITSDFVLLDNS